MLDKRKVVIIGAGHVGSHVAMALCFQGTCDEIVLIDRDREKAVSNSYDVADACLLVVRFDCATTQEIRDSIWRLDKSGIPIIGCIVNGVMSFTTGLDRSSRSGKKTKKTPAKNKRKDTEKSIQKQEWEDWEKEHSDNKES